jgi:hypothetical protein
MGLAHEGLPRYRQLHVGLVNRSADRGRRVGPLKLTLLGFRPNQTQGLDPGMWNHPLQVSVFCFSSQGGKDVFSGLLVATC